MGKGRPTPKRREAEAARKRPLVPDRKEAARQQRAAAKARRDREYQAMLSGDERNMPVRDRGPVRRWVRDFIDARRNPGEYFLPVSIAIVFSTFLVVAYPPLVPFVYGLMYAVILVATGDAIWLSFRLKKLVTAKFGADALPRGIRVYGVLRAFQLRRTRLPKPQVKRGEFPS